MENKRWMEEDILLNDFYRKKTKEKFDVCKLTDSPCFTAGEHKYFFPANGILWSQIQKDLPFILGTPKLKESLEVVETGLGI